MSKKKTPILQALRKNGGTVYVFPSASEDVGLNLQSSTTGAALSHYALLRLPALTKEQLLCDHALSHESTSFTGNNYYAMSLQNYMMNFETLLTNQENYNYQEQATVTEKVFWHWMNKIGALNFDSLTEAATGIYYENNQTSKVVQCFGSIDAGNVLSSTFGMFNETYITIPSSYGDGPVYFTFSEDSNYPFNKTYTVDSSDYLEGRSNTKHTSYSNQNDYPFCDTVTATESSYVIPSSRDGLSIAKDLLTINKGLKGQFAVSTDVTSYDDINIDINNQFKTNNDEVDDFEFNAILLYYSLYDQDDAVKTAYAINLFGIIFLDGAEDDVTTITSGSSSQDVSTYAIPTLTKTKSSAESFGNSYSFRVNMKSMSVYDNTDAVIQDDTTAASTQSTDLSDAIANLNLAVEVLNNNTRVIANIQNAYASILSYYDTQAEEIENISTALSAYVSGARSSYIDTSVLQVQSVQTRYTDTNEINFYSFITNPVDPDEDEIRELIATMNSDGFYAPRASLDKLDNKETFVDISDIQTGSDNRIDADNNAQNTVAQMFNGHGYLEIMAVPSGSVNADGVMINETNRTYINPNSTAFTNQNTAISLAAFKSGDGNINYVGLIPYIIYQLQELTVNTYENNPLTEQKADAKYLKHMTEIGYSALCSAVANGTLIAGQFYRITDYVTTTTATDTVSAGKPFDVIVRADSTNTLNAQAWAIQRTGNTTDFVNSRINMWELKYDINNDTAKYEWADASNGTGVIYYMKDEFGNECPYDFKNIKFTNFKYIDASSNVSTETSNYVYTFASANSSTCTDQSLDGYVNEIYNNVIRQYATSGKAKLNKNICLGSACWGNTFGTRCYNNTFGQGCNSNTFGQICYNNTFGQYCSGNIFGQGCNSNTFVHNCAQNTFGQSCSSNTFTQYCNNNTFSDMCNNNTFGDSCYDNTFENSCYYNKFEGQNFYNKLEHNCTNNVFGTECWYNIFMNNCEHNTFGQNCYNNTFENACQYITFKNGTYDVAYMKNVHIFEANAYIDFTYSDTTGYKMQLQNIQVMQGLSGDSSTHKTITITKAAGDKKPLIIQSADTSIMIV